MLFVVVLAVIITTAQEVIAVSFEVRAVPRRVRHKVRLYSFSGILACGTTKCALIRQKKACRGEADYAPPFESTPRQRIFCD